MVQLSFGRASQIAILDVVLVLLSLAVSSSSTWATSNSQGPISYKLVGAGFPLPYVLLQMYPAKVGPSSYVQVDPLFLVADLVFWLLICFVAFRLWMPKRTALRA
jgi:hypothetical protein